MEEYNESKKTYRTGTVWDHHGMQTDTVTYQLSVIMKVLDFCLWQLNHYSLMNLWRKNRQKRSNRNNIEIKAHERKRKKKQDLNEQFRDIPVRQEFRWHSDRRTENMQYLRNKDGRDRSWNWSEVKSSLHRRNVNAQ